MKVLTLSKKNATPFFEALKSFGKTYGPVEKGEKAYSFQPVESFSQLALDYKRTILPLKKFFYKPCQPVFHFNKDSGYQPAEEDLEEKIVLFGVHPCDINALNILDLVNSGPYVDNYYFVKRQNNLIIGISCMPDELCFCRSMSTDFAETGFDLFLSDIGDSYVVRVGTGIGDDMVNAVPDLFSPIDEESSRAYKDSSNERSAMFQRYIELSDLPEIMDLEFHSELWEKLGERCLACGSCSMICPTCNCYNIIDKLNLDQKTGERIRQWDSCLFKDFAEVSGGHNFRSKRASRVQQRYLHKQQGFVEQYGRPSCVGCGRCTMVCPAKIDIVEILHTIRGERNHRRRKSDRRR